LFSNPLLSIRHPREKISSFYFLTRLVNTLINNILLTGFKFIAMVQVDISQLSGECNVWREKLRNYREEFSNHEAKLRQVAGQTLSKEQLKDVEHLHNQFHIQLINIHDLKQAIKAHDRKINFEKAVFNGSANEDSLAQHERMNDEYQRLEETLAGLRKEFAEFLKQVQ
jgi:benzoyl-CoA reductase/2-hydroxyglutaryl-CoA dehydratase subunit BcrC/BadD/HgdB